MRGRGILGLISGLLLVLSSLAHAFLGFPPLRTQLTASAAAEDVVGALAIGWYFGSAAMATFGLIVLTSGANALKGKASGLAAVRWIALAYALFGLAAFTTEQRTKEIGIRKVLGASVAGITGLLAKDFMKLVVIAILIASPLAYFFMKKWLLDFAYRIDIQWWNFLVAGVVAVAIAFITVGFQSVKAALANPIKSLRSE